MSRTQFELGTLEITVDPTADKPTLSPSQVKQVIRTHAGYSTSAAGKRTVNRVKTGNPEESVTVAQAVKQYLSWQRANHGEAVQAYQTGILELATALCTGNFHVDVQASSGGRVSITADYTGSLSSRMTDLQAITALVNRLNG